EKELLSFQYAVRHVERRPATDTRRGRLGRWPREKLLEAARQLRGILQRETSGRVSLNSFIGQYLQVLHFPADVLEALACCKSSHHSLKFFISSTALLHKSKWKQSSAKQSLRIAHAA
ncbi:MAG TPA: hypothetical protein VNO70_27155, partial [Blastocatellia bacterium]|nr:hypothetical protein [Blastocatellia bacterium]